MDGKISICLSKPASPISIPSLGHSPMALLGFVLPWEQLLPVWGSGILRNPLFSCSTPTQREEQLPALFSIMCIFSTSPGFLCQLISFRNSINHSWIISPVCWQLKSASKWGPLTLSPSPVEKSLGIAAGIKIMWGLGWGWRGKTRKRESWLLWEFLSNIPTKFPFLPYLQSPISLPSLHPCGNTQIIHKNDWVCYWCANPSRNLEMTEPSRKKQTEFLNIPLGPISPLRAAIPLPAPPDPGRVFVLILQWWGGWSPPVQQ